MDPDGDPLTYVWSVTSRPSGSTAALSNANIVNPTFKPDKPGTYIIQLIVNDGTVNSAADTVTLTTFQETIVENWDDGVLAPWSKDSSGSWGTINVDDEEPYSGKYSFWAQGAWAGGNTLMHERVSTCPGTLRPEAVFSGIRLLIIDIDGAPASAAILAPRCKHTIIPIFNNRFLECSKGYRVGSTVYRAVVHYELDYICSRFVWLEGRVHDVGIGKRRRTPGRSACYRPYIGQRVAVRIHACAPVELLRDVVTAARDVSASLCCRCTVRYGNF